MSETNQFRLPDPEVQPTMPVWPDVANALGLSKQSTYNAIARGEIPSIRIGHRLLVPTAALRRMLGVDKPTTPVADSAVV